MANAPWTDSDPQPGDFDAELDRAPSDQIEIHEGNPDAKLSIIVSVEGDDAKHLERIAERDQEPREVVSWSRPSLVPNQSLKRLKQAGRIELGGGANPRPSDKGQPEDEGNQAYD